MALFKPPPAAGGFITALQLALAFRSNAPGAMMRLAIVALLSICFAWVLFAALYHPHEHLDDEGASFRDSSAIAGAMPGRPSVVRRRVHGSVGPVVKPKGGAFWEASCLSCASLSSPLTPPPTPSLSRLTPRRAGPSMLSYLGETFNLRQCSCYRDWASRPGEPVCKCDKMCPARVTPLFLTEAEGQALCSLEEAQGYNCYAGCDGDEVKWYAKGCGDGAAQEQCDKPILAPRREARLKAAQEPPAAAPPPPQEPAAAAAAAPPPPADPPQAPVPGKGNADKIGDVPLPYSPAEYVDLRGLKCEKRGGNVTCFLEDEQGREVCPPSVTLDYLANPSDQYLCSAEMSRQYYCTVGCQEGNPEVRWGANEVAWCSQPGNAAGCPVRKPPVARAALANLPEWSAPVEPVSPCQAAWKAGERPKTPIARVSVGLLTHEPISFRASMTTYEALGLFDVFGEFMIYINKRTPATDEVAAEFASRHANIRVMGSEENIGILRAMNLLVAAAKEPHFMFLERDFQLLEPATCIVEQLNAGVKLLEAGTAHVVRYRHKKHPGRPNWAARMFMGKEDEVFKRGQPNLFCNHHYWYEEPEKRWPDKLWVCMKVGD